MPSWNVLNLHARRLSVSKYPEWAQVYVCDQCGADLTKFVRRGWGSHGANRIGPASRTCSCGKVFETGYVEWDHLTSVEQRHESRGFLPLLLIVLVVSAGLGVPIGFLTYETFGSWKAGFVGTMLAGGLLVLYVNLSFWVTVTASRRRTGSGAL
jgi:hypothetical protein